MFSTWNKRTHGALTVALSLALAGHGREVAAQGAPPETLTVTATRTPLKMSEVLAQVVAIDRETIVSAGFASLAELLQRYAGIEYRATGGPGQPTGVFLRGANAQHTLVLVDGQRIGSSTSGSAAFENLSLDMIERIEVVRGPMSALYGSDAIGGVVQIFTRKPAGDRREAALTAGSYGARALRAGFTAVVEKTALSLDASLRRIDAPSATNRDAGAFVYHPDKDPYRNSHVELKLTHELWQGEHLQFSAWQSEGRTHFDSGAGSDPVNRQKLSGVQLTSENRLSDRWKARVALGETRDDARLSGPFPGDFRTVQRQYTWHNDIDAGGTRFIAGIERREESVSGTTAFLRDRRDTTAFYLGAHQKVDDHTWSLNTRHDRERQFGERTTGGIAWGYQLWPDELIYLSYGQAFRAPSFNDLYYPGFSNPALRPEKSESGEFGWRVTRKAFRIDFAFFAHRIDDLIVFDSATSQPQNLRQARIAGWEYALDTQFLGLDWRGRITRQRAEDAASGAPLRGRAKTFGSIGASKHWNAWGDWQAGTDLVSTDARYDSTNAAPASRLPGMALWNAHLRYRWNREWAVELIGSNLADRRHEAARGYDALGRQVQVQFRYDSR